MRAEDELRVGSVCAGADGGMGSCGCVKGLWLLF